MKDEFAEPRESAIETLRASIAALETGDVPSERIEGHGIQSQYFCFAWSEPTLGIDLRLPFARILADEDDQRFDNARIGTACRLAVLPFAIL